MTNNSQPLQLWVLTQKLLALFRALEDNAGIIESLSQDMDEFSREILAFDITEEVLSPTSPWNDPHDTYGREGAPIANKETLLELRDYIISNGDLHTAADIVEATPRIPITIDFLKSPDIISENKENTIDFLQFIQTLISELDHWVQIWCVHHETTFTSILERRGESPYFILRSNSSAMPTMTDIAEHPENQDNFSQYIKPHVTTARTVKLYVHIKQLSTDKKDNYISDIAAFIAVLYDEGVLARNYKDTLTYVFKIFGINEDPAKHKPAQYRRTSIKGTHNASYLAAIEKLKSL